MVEVNLETSTLSVLIAGLYTMNTGINPIAIPESVYLEIAEKLEFFLPTWDYSIISFEDWVKYGLTILPVEMITDEDLDYMQENTLYWERMVGNATLVVSMDISDINAQ